METRSNRDTAAIRKNLITKYNMNWNHCMDPLDNDHPFKIQLGKDKMRHFCMW